MFFSTDYIPIKNMLLEEDDLEINDYFRKDQRNFLISLALSLIFLDWIYLLFFRN